MSHRPAQENHKDMRSFQPVPKQALTYFLVQIIAWLAGLNIFEGRAPGMLLGLTRLLKPSWHSFAHPPGRVPFGYGFLSLSEGIKAEYVSGSRLLHCTN